MSKEIKLITMEQVISTNKGGVNNVDDMERQDIFKKKMTITMRDGTVMQMTPGEWKKWYREYKEEKERKRLEAAETEENTETCN